ncbi:hypothetical protein DPMN_132316 [Dreissena polymorpha]|uniref:Uncharacterized protein n=1 Tax=Dreissena polymorpha TaxID=45954 RepID=A0A9D4FS94_DREPO|nr:hypothetical protein DPMN_132316 [Dreissena polymorpha]
MLVSAVQVRISFVTVRDDPRGRRVDFVSLPGLVVWMPCCHLDNGLCKTIDAQKFKRPRRVPVLDTGLPCPSVLVWDWDLC